MRWVAVVVIALIVPACSLFMVDGPPATPTADAPPCTRSYAIPIVDAVLAAGSIAGGVAVGYPGAKADGRTEETIRAAVFAPPLLALGVTYVVSALVGRARVGRCAGLVR